MGSGTTLVEAKLLGRNAIGVDVNPQSVLISESKLDIEHFLVVMNKVAKESYRVQKQGKMCAVMIGDMRKSGNVVPFGTIPSSRNFAKINFS